jgi:hypothetical protein
VAGFTDDAGRQWDVRITIGVCRRVAERLGVYLMQAGGDLADRLMDDAALVADVLWAILEAQAVERKVTREAFDEALTGRTLGAAQNALWEALLDFIPPARRAEATGRLLARDSTTIRWIEAGRAVIAAAASQTTAGEDGSGSSPTPPASSDSIPAP